MAMDRGLCPGWDSNSSIRGSGRCRWISHRCLTSANADLLGRTVMRCTGLLCGVCDHGVTTSTSDHVWNPAELQLRPSR